MTIDQPRGPQREARISLAHLVANIAVLGADGFTLDLSADAFGHGAERVAAAAENAGVTSFSVRSQREAQHLDGVLSTYARLAVGPVDEHAVTHAYGLDPNRHRGTAPVMRLSARVLAVKEIAAGAGVSYGYTWRAPDDGWLALVPLGYGDGFIRAWGNRASAVWRDHECALAGRVAMDAHSIYTGSQPAEIGDEVVYFGDGTPGSATAASLAQTVSAPAVSVPSALGARISRVYIDAVMAS